MKVEYEWRGLLVLITVLLGLGFFQVFPVLDRGIVFVIGFAVGAHLYRWMQK